MGVYMWRADGEPLLTRIFYLPLIGRKKFWFASTGKLIVLNLKPSKAMQNAPHIFIISKFSLLRSFYVFFSFSAKIQMEEVS